LSTFNLYLDSIAFAALGQVCRSQTVTEFHFPSVIRFLPSLSTLDNREREQEREREREAACKA